jgi:hypothetical protein
MSLSLPDVVSAQGLTGCVDDGGTCGKKIVGRGRCRKHYGRWWRSTRDTVRAPALNLKTKTPADRYWEKVDRRGPDDCWPWRRTTDEFGHGQFFVSPERGRVPAHVYGVELTTGQRCPEGKEGCHHCDNPPCCNPAHIYYGTRQQNVDDMWNRNRAPQGADRTQSKVDDHAVLAIRLRFADGETLLSLASEYGVSDTLISLIVNGHRWSHVGGPVGTHGRRGRRPNHHYKESA